MTRKHAQNELNNTHGKIIKKFRKEYLAAMKYMENISSIQEMKSCPSCTEGKAVETSLRQEQKNRYANLEAVLLDTTGLISRADSEGYKFVQILIDFCTG